MDLLKLCGNKKPEIFGCLPRYCMNDKTYLSALSKLRIPLNIPDSFKHFSNTYFCNEFWVNLQLQPFTHQFCVTQPSWPCSLLETWTFWAMPALPCLPLQHRNTEHGVGKMALQNIYHTSHPCIQCTTKALSAYALHAPQIWCFLITTDSLCPWCRASSHGFCEYRVVRCLVHTQMGSMLTAHLSDTTNHCNLSRWHSGR